MNLPILILSSFALAVIPVTAQEDVAKPYTLTRSEEFTLKNEAGESYRIMVSLPQQSPPAGGHAVAYLLDGDELFPVLTSVLQLQAGTAKGSKHNDIQPGIIVGIGYGGTSRRDYDYTPESPAGPPETYRNGEPYPQRKSGGSQRFLDFLEQRVKPEIAKRYPVDTGRQTLVGNGFGGLFALHVLFTKPSAFQNYVASSPSIWWNDRYILSEEKKFTGSDSKAIPTIKLLLTVGELEQSLTRTEASWDEAEREEHRLKVTRRKMLDNTRELAWKLEDANKPGLEVSIKSFPDQSHKSVIPMALGYSLSFVFPPRKAE